MSSSCAAFHIPSTLLLAAPPLLPGTTIPSLPAILGLVIQTEDAASAPAIGRASGVTILFTA